MCAILENPVMDQWIYGAELSTFSHHVVRKHFISTAHCNEQWYLNVSDRRNKKRCFTFSERHKRSSILIDDPLPIRPLIPFIKAARHFISLCSCTLSTKRIGKSRCQSLTIKTVSNNACKQFWPQKRRIDRRIRAAARADKVHLTEVKRFCQRYHLSSLVDPKI